MNMDFSDLFSLRAYEFRLMFYVQQIANLVQ